MTKELIITLISGARDALIRTAQAVPDDKFNWHPLDAGRSVRELLGDAAQMPKMVQVMLESRGEKVPSLAMYHELKAECENWSRDEMISHLQANCDALFPLINALSEEELAREISVPMGKEMTMTFALWILMTHRTITNRYAQINYIQTLYGDTEFH